MGIKYRTSRQDGQSCILCPSPSIGQDLTGIYEYDAFLSTRRPYDYRTSLWTQRHIPQGIGDYLGPYPLLIVLNSDKLPENPSRSIIQGYPLIGVTGDL